MVAMSRRRHDVLRGHEVVGSPYEAGSVSRLSEAPVGGFAGRERDRDGGNTNRQRGGGVGKVRPG